MAGLEGITDEHELEDAIAIRTASVSREIDPARSREIDAKADAAIAREAARVRAGWSEKTLKDRCGYKSPQVIVPSARVRDSRVNDHHAKE